METEKNEEWIVWKLYYHNFKILLLEAEDLSEMLSSTVEREERANIQKEI